MKPVVGVVEELAQAPSGGDGREFDVDADKAEQLVVVEGGGSSGSTLFPNGEVPRFLTNATSETYDQYSHGGMCMGCHAKATSTAGQDASFNFLLSKAR